MKERPILFSAPMVRAILEGRKTQTRRVVNHPAIADLSYIVDCGNGLWGDEEGDVQVLCPYGQPGDRLWVRETYQVEPSGHGPTRIIYKAGGESSVVLAGDQIAQADRLWTDPDVFRPSIHMPRCRLTPCPTYPHPGTAALSGS